MSDNELSSRKQQILYHAIEDYIESASPITSGAMVNKTKAQLSSATLRNELSALEQMGYLKQLHTSGGRVPTTKGYRFFVNTLQANCKVDLEGLVKIKHVFERRTMNLSELLKAVADRISEVTNYPTVISFGGIDKLEVISIKIIPLMTCQALMLIETPHGLLNNTLETAEVIDEQSCLDAGRVLTDKFKGMTIGGMAENIRVGHKQILQELNEYAAFFEMVLNSLIELTKRYKQTGSIYSKGATKLLKNPEYDNVEKVKDVLELLEDKEKLKNIMDDDSAGADVEVEFQIGDELRNEKLADCTIAKAHCRFNGENIANVGIIGPKRMDYAKISSALKFIVDEFNKTDLLESAKSLENDNK